MARKAPARKGAAKGKARAAAKGKQTAYQKRLRTYQREHPGWKSDPHWKQHARGHTVSEHVTRKSREADKIRRYAEESAKLSQGSDPDELEEIIRENVREHGMTWLARLIALRRERNAEYNRQPYVRDSRGKLRRQTLGLNIDDMAESYDVPVELFFYH
jgi:hypothetical protein